MDVYYPGQQILFATSYVDEYGVEMDPTDPIVTLFDPIDGVTTLALGRVDVGEYTLQWTIPSDAAAGFYRYKYSGIATVNGVQTTLNDGPYYFQVIVVGQQPPPPLPVPLLTVTLDATVGGATANTYVTMEEAVTYIANKPAAWVAAWNALSGNDQARCLIEATLQLDRNRIQGFRVFATLQALNFPRIWPFNADDPGIPTVNTIPLTVKQAQIEQALWIAQNMSRNYGFSQRQQLQQAGVASFAVGDFRETFSASSLVFLPQLCPIAKQLMEKWIDRSVRVISWGREAVVDSWSDYLDARGDDDYS